MSLELLMLNQEWTNLNRDIECAAEKANKILHKEIAGSFSEYHDKNVELLKKKSELWDQAIRAGYELQDGVFKFKHDFEEDD